MSNVQILCDTNIVSELARPSPNAGVIAWSQQLQSVTISVITVEEISYGLASVPNQRVQAESVLREAIALSDSSYTISLPGRV